MIPKTFPFLSIIFFSFASFAQTTNNPDLAQELKPLYEKVEALEAQNKSLNARLNNEIKRFNDSLSVASAKIDGLQKQIQTNSDAINKTEKDLGSKIDETKSEADKKIANVDDLLSKTMLWAIIGILAAIVVSGVVYLLLSKRQKTDKTDMIAQLRKTKSAIEENLVNEFDKLTELMDAQLKTLELSKQNPSAEIDHSLALKVASEINVIERNINLMDAKTKGLRQLGKSVEKLKDNLAANGYEMPPLLGKQFDQGMKVIVANSVPDESLEKDVEIITKILIPQVNYNGTMIQTAQIETSKGY
jgi:hypothetical protein